MASQRVTYDQIKDNNRLRKINFQFMVSGISKTCMIRLKGLIEDKYKYCIYRNISNDDYEGYIVAKPSTRISGFGRKTSLYVGESTSIPIVNTLMDIRSIRYIWKTRGYEYTEIGNWENIIRKTRRVKLRGYTPRKNHLITEYTNNKTSIIELSDSESSTIDEDHWVICNNNK